jgi:hypothetical protein
VAAAVATDFIGSLWRVRAHAADLPVARARRVA